MQEIRFNSPNIPSGENLEEKNNVDNLKKDKKRKPFVSFFLLFLKVAVLLSLVYGGIIASRYLFAGKVENNSYTAVFLTNGQVYFGKILENDRQEMILKEVYYLQNASANFSPNEPNIQGTSFTLVKLGQELHGPTDLMYINKEQVLFYEYLRDDSELVKTIADYKNN